MVAALSTVPEFTTSVPPLPIVIDVAAPDICMVPPTLMPLAEPST
jgi:hypothetical protein